MATEIRTIEFYWNDDADKTIESADVVVGDGTIKYDEEYDEFDPRIFFYFHDEAEFTQARKGNADNVEFTITGVEV